MSDEDKFDRNVQPGVQKAEDSPKTPETRDELTAEELDEVSGGTGDTAPRDAASGLPTGKRTH